MTRTIKTYYFNRRHEVIRVNSSTDANRAVAIALLHMQVNHYGARVAQVVDDETSEIHAEVKRGYRGNIEITYQRDPAQYERRISLINIQESL